jgi:hypothetical protein
MSNSAHHELSAAQPEKHGLTRSIDTLVGILSLPDWLLRNSPNYRAVLFVDHRTGSRATIGHQCRGLR